MAVDADSPDRELSKPTESTPSGDTADNPSETPQDAAEETGAAANEAHPEDHDDAEPEAAAPAKRSISDVRLGLVLGLVMVLALAGLVGWLGYRTYQSQQAEAQRRLFLEVGRQGALNLTTISYTEVEADVQRILDGSTGTFYDDFQKRSQPFIDVVKQAQSKTVGTITEAGLESVQGDSAQVLVALSVKTSNAGAAEQEPRGWRMRIDVQKVGDGAKVSNVEFVP
jgi:Mce-associated membrane protein